MIVISLPGAERVASCEGEGSQGVTAGWLKAL